MCGTWINQIDEFMKKLNRILYILPICALLLGACEKEGPAGPQGEPGTANVKYSEWKTLPFDNSGSDYIVTIDEPEITKEILNNGEVAVYMGDENSWAVKLNYYAGTHYAMYSLEEGKIRIDLNYVIWADSKFRFIIIPGGVQFRSKKQVDLNNYLEVIETFHIPE